MVKIYEWLIRVLRLPTFQYQAENMNDFSDKP